MNILLTISYDGTGYSGWQRQSNAVSVQERIEHALFRLYGCNLPVTGASRTDAGVHALCQKATYRPNGNKFPLERLPLAINTYLPSDIAVTKAETVPSEFHPRFSAKQKTYEYKIYNCEYPNPILRLYSWHVYKNLNTSGMFAAARHFTGTFDFSAFCASGAVQNHVRTVSALDITADGQIITIRITADGFLYNMVRIITGTLVYVGLGKIHERDIPGIIRAKDRSLSGITAPPQGLTLLEIIY